MAVPDVCQYISVGHALKLVDVLDVLLPLAFPSVHSVSCCTRQTATRVASPNGQIVCPVGNEEMCFVVADAPQLAVECSRELPFIQYRCRVECDGVVFVFVGVDQNLVFAPGELVQHAFAWDVCEPFAEEAGVELV